MIVLSSPSGAGKTTLTRKLLEENPADIILSISATTRHPRPGEIEGIDYYFVSKTDFSRMIETDDLLEHARVFDHFYGTPRGPVEAALEGAKDVIFDVDWQGAQQLAQAAADDLVKIFVLPPSMVDLENRLKARAQDSAETIARRMAKSEAEISHWAEYDYVIVNADLDAAMNELRVIIMSERMKRKRQLWLGPFVRSLTQGG
ncbi:MAG: guanylate kinase [Hyphomonadaceae bacterium]|nr:guanylate kinase [Hyphomonadaceae bacterium]MBC6412114.1 guanylate kinase [Hyphomonadaceae bacterium]